MKLVILCDSDVFAGTERHMDELAAELKSLGADVSLACPLRSPLVQRAQSKGVPTITIEKRGLLDWPAIRKLVRLLRSGEADVIHAHNGRCALLATTAARIAGRGHVIVTQHFLTPSYVSRRGPKAVLSTAMHRWVDRRIDHVIAISNAAAEGILKRGEATPDGITVVPNGISPINPATLRARNEVRSELQIAPDQPLLACVARLQLEKDILSLVKAMAIVAQTRPDIRCVVAGDGDQEPILRTEIARLRQHDTVRLLGFRHDAHSIIAAADAFVLSSLAEPFGLVLLEAMSLGLPVIATRAGGPLEIVVDHETGLLVPPSSPDQLAAAILELTADSARRQSMGAHGRERFLQHFTARRMAEQTLAVYRKVLGLEPASASSSTPFIASLPSSSI